MNPFSALVDLIYPRHCMACGGPVGEEGGYVCWDCMIRVDTVAAPFCRICGDPVDGVVDHDYVCAWCTDSPPWFDLARSAARYRGPLRRLLHAFKYEGGVCLCGDLVRYLDACLTAQYGAVRPDAVAAVPLHPRKERERTYNQSALLAGALARRRGWPLLRRCLARTRETATQTHLSASERRRNVGGAFVATNPAWIDGRRIMLVDDVMTTGATVNEVSCVLKKAGAAAVYVLSVARG